MVLSFLLAIASLTAPITSPVVATNAAVVSPAVPRALPPSPPPAPSDDPSSDDNSYRRDYSSDYSDEDSVLVLDPNKMGQAYDDAREDTATQWEFPEHKVEPPPEWLKALGRLFAGAGGFFTILFYIIVVLVIVAILYALFPPFRDMVDRTMGRFRAREGEDQEEDWAPQTSVAFELLAEADKLAAEGRYAEAVHLLLGRSIEDIGRRRPQLLRPALTARDIARSPDLPEIARDAFTTIANVVELSHFGRRPVDADGWQQCRDAYSRFALRESWSANSRDMPLTEAAPA